MARRSAARERELDAWLDRHGYRHDHAAKPHPYAVSLRSSHATRARGDEGGQKFKAGDIVRRTAARMRSMGLVSGPVNGIVVGYSGKWPLVRWSNMDETDEPMAQAEEGLELDKRAMSRRGHARAKDPTDVDLDDRLFIGTFPTGIRYADKKRERGGDYLPLAFLPFRTLELEWQPRVSVPLDLRYQIEQHAAGLRARRGESYPVSASGQTVKLGHARVIRQEPTGRPVFAAHERDGDITTAGRRALRADQFALPPGPEEKRRGIKGRFPIDEIARARNALARAAQLRKRGKLSAAQLATVRRRVRAAWPSIDVEGG